MKVYRTCFHDLQSKALSTFKGQTSLFGISSSGRTIILSHAPFITKIEQAKSAALVCNTFLRVNSFNEFLQ